MIWMPHRHCLGWDSWIVWLLAICGALIFLIYQGTGLALWYRLRRSELAPSPSLRSWPVPMVATWPLIRGTET